MGWRKDREDQLSAELAEHLRCGNTHMVFDPYYRSVADTPYNNGASLRDRSDGLRTNQASDLDHHSDRFHDR